MNLIDYQEDKYREFHKKLITSSYPLLGVKITILRRLAKTIDYDMYIQNMSLEYYEDIILYGMIIVKEKDELKRKTLIDDYLKYIDCWSICDTFCTNLSYVKKNLDNYFEWILNYLEDERPFYVRFGLVMLLKYYSSEKYINVILSKVDKIKNNDYYCQMGIAWLLCELAVINKNKIDIFVKKQSLNIQKMYLRKVKDSFRIK